MPGTPLQHIIYMDSDEGIAVDGAEGENEEIGEQLDMGLIAAEQPVAHELRDGDEEDDGLAMEKVHREADYSANREWMELALAAQPIAAEKRNVIGEQMDVDCYGRDNGDDEQNTGGEMGTDTEWR